MEDEMGKEEEGKGEVEEEVEDEVENKGKRN